jgi:acyl-CoA synthetase (NDP forming)/GNAT superfamily N-acetyltransferase
MNDIAPRSLPRPADVLLADGRIAAIRPLVPTDRDGLMALHDAAGDESLRLRFFSLSREAARAYVDHLMTGSGDTVATLVATVGGTIVATAVAERIGPDVAEAAFLVADAEHRHGLGSLLLEHLAAACRDVGVRRLVAEVLPANHAMLTLFRGAGFSQTQRNDHGVLLVEMSTEATAAAVEVADRRERASEARSLAPLLHPRSVAVVGVRHDGSGLGHAVLTSVLEGGFTGAVHVVHPDVDSVDGVRAVRRLTDVPGHVDVAIVAVPADHVLDAVRDAARAGVSAVVVISSGFGELGADGARRQQRVLRTAREHNIRLIGPNCLGVLVNDPAVRLNATFTRSVPPPGGLAVASQSGGVGIAFLDLARELGLGVGSFISLGNKADVSGNDLLAAWLDDPAVTGAALYLESFGNAPKFARIARRFAERKPVLAVVGGRSASGRRGGASHTAAAATPAVGIDALFSQAGVLGCASAEAMGRAALLLSEQPLPGGRRVGVVSNAGGLGILAADAADLHGLDVPELSSGLRAEISGHVAGTTGTANPVDLGAGARPDDLRSVAAALLGSAEVDALLVVLVPTSVAPAQPLVDALVATRARFPDTPVVLVGLGGLGRDDLGRSATGLTVFRAVGDAVEAMGTAARYASWLATPRTLPAPHDGERATAARRVALGLLDDLGTGDGWVDAADVPRLLGPYGLAPVGRLATDAVAATRIAAEVGYPVVVKVADRDVVHKSDRGLVRLGLESDEEVDEAVRDFAAELGRSEVAVLVQPLVRGVEIALGVVRDPSLGPLVMVAAGGVATGVLDDRSFLLPPFSRQDAARAVRSLRTWPLLDGYRGTPPVDTAGLERAVVALGDLALDVPEVAELDLNPVMCTSGGCVLVDVRIRLVTGPRDLAAQPRQLRAQ